MKKSLSFLISLCGSCVLVGCGSGNSTTPPPAAISIELSPNSAQALDVNQSASITANVSNDSSNQGVKWTVTCPAGVNACGAMAQTKTASGAPNKFVAPANVSAAEIATVTATSVTDSTQSKSVRVTVNPALSLVNPPPVQPQFATAGQPFSLNLMSFVQGGTPPFTWSITSGALPAGLNLNASTGMITGTPSTPAVASVFAFTCSDSGNPFTFLPGNLEMSLTINAPGSLTITSGAPPNGTVGAPYGGTHSLSGHSFAGFPLTATGGRPSYTWSWSAAQGSSLPPGLNPSLLYISGGSTRCCVYVLAIAGTPTTAGTYKVVVIVTDSGSPAAQVSANYTIVISSAQSTSIAISSQAPPNGTVGAPYSPKITGYCQPVGSRCYPCFPAASTRICGPGYRTLYSYGFSFSATGGVPPYSWSWAQAQNSSLPTGLTLSADGMISGTPTSPGSYNVIVKAIDTGSSAAETNVSYTIVISSTSSAVASAMVGPSSRERHARYKLIDVGTLGGPNSNPALPFFEGIVAPSLSQSGTFAGQAETSTPDPFRPNCFNADCHVTHAIKWEEGVRTDLGALPGPAGLSSATTWISGNGLIVGFSENGEVDPFTGVQSLHGVVWKHEEIFDLGTLKGGYESVANAINNRGEVVGYANNAKLDPESLAGMGSQTRAVAWWNGKINDLGTLGGTDAVALHVNDLGQITGESYTSSSIPSPVLHCGDSPLTVHAFIWENGKMTDLKTLGGSCAFAYSLNNRGQVVGQANLTGDQESHPFLWELGVMKDLGALGGTYGYAGWLNDAGQVVGAATDKDDQRLLAFRWEDGEMTNLGTLIGDACSVSDAINSRGQVVGGSGLSISGFFPACTDPVEHAVLWENGEALDLNTLVPSHSDLMLSEATFINDRGEISGFGTVPNGDQHAFLLIPCDGDHADFESCNDLDATAETQGNAPPASMRAANVAAGSPTPERFADVSARLARRYHVPVVATPKN